MGLKILVLEDDVADADLVVRMLKRSGIESEPVVVSGKKDYLHAIDSTHFDLVLSDHSLPQFNSVEAFEALKQCQPDTAFILVTGTVSEEFAVEMIQKGVDDYILKGNLKRLPSAITRSMEKRRAQQERDKAVQELQNAHERLLFHVENTPLGFIEWDHLLNIKSWSRRAGEILGCSEEHPVTMIKAEDFPDKLLAKKMADQLVSGAAERSSFQHMSTTCDGRMVWCQWFNSVLKDEMGKIVTIMSLVQDITEQKKAEMELIQSEKYNRNLFDQSTQGLALSSMRTGRFVDVNPAYANILGYTIEECKSLTYFEVTPKKYEGKELEILQQLKDTGHFGPYEKESIRKDGHLVNVRLSGTILDRNGEEYIWASVEDITESKKTEQALKRSLIDLQMAAERQSTLINSLGSQVALLDEKGRIIEVNDAWQKFHDLNDPAGSGKSIVGKDYIYILENTIGTEGSAEKDIADAIRDIINGRITEFSTEYPYHTIKEKVWFRTTITQINQDDHKGAVVSHTNISESRLAEDLKYRQIVETAEEGIWMVDENDRTNFVNEKLCKMLEYTSEEVVGKPRSFFMDEEGRKILAESGDIIRKNTKSILDFKFITKSGREFWTNLSTNPVFNEEGIYKGTLAMVTDITQRKMNDILLKKSETKLERKNEELERKNIELEQFAYVASHDLQEPLRTTSSFVELFQKQYRGQLDERADQYLTYIIQASDRMKLLIKDLLDYSRIGKETEWDKVDCDKILRHVIADIGKAIADTDANIKVEPLPVINGYDTEIKQLFQNLLLNALKFRNKDIQLEVNISASLKDDMWQFSFADNGIGIEKKHHERIFVIFQRLHNRTEFEGSGIGLSHCRKIVELHNGRIWVESAPGAGSTFFFTIPFNQTVSRKKLFLAS